MKLLDFLFLSLCIDKKCGHAKLQANLKLVRQSCVLKGAVSSFIRMKAQTLVDNLSELMVDSSLGTIQCLEEIVSNSYYTHMDFFCVFSVVKKTTEQNIEGYICISHKMHFFIKKKNLSSRAAQYSQMKSHYILRLMALLKGTLVVVMKEGQALLNLSCQSRG